MMNMKGSGICRFLVFLVILSFVAHPHTVMALNGGTSEGSTVRIVCRSARFTDSTKVLFRIVDRISTDLDTVDVRRNELVDYFQRSYHDSVFFTGRIFSPSFAVLHCQGIFDQMLIVVPGDSVEIIEQGGNLKFYGKYSKRYSCQHEIWELEKRLGIFYQPLKSDDDLIPVFRHVDSLCNEALNILEHYKVFIEPPVHRILKMAIIETFQGAKDQILNDLIERKTLDSTDLRLRLSKYVNPIWNKSVLNDYKESPHSIDWLRFLVGQLRFDDMLLNRNYDLQLEYQYFLTRFNGSELSFIAYELIRTNLKSHSDQVGMLIHEVEKDGIVKNRSVERYFEQVLISSIPGSRAYEFGLKDNFGRIVRLSDLRGKVVLLDFWHIGCGPCILLHPYLDSILCAMGTDSFRIVSICLNYGGYSDSAWLDEIKRGRYTSSRSINLSCDPNSKVPGQSIVAYYLIHEDPTLILIDKYGAVMRHPINPREDGGISLMKEINEALHD
jgi:thiol-disulfide isomerase/thioredoxin